MKLNQLMLAPVALGMIAPVAANASELNMVAVNQYSESQVTSINQFSDVRPTDWAYQALSNLVERYGCVAGYPNGTFGGGRAMTRFEAAALLNACLDRVTETTDELKRLLNEFQTELATLRGRVDGLEQKVGVLEAQQFSTTTKLRGEVNMMLGGVNGAQLRNGTNVGGATFNYDLRLNFDTSFTGKDLLRTRLRSGNFSAQPFGSANSVFKLDKAETSQGTGTNSNVWLDRLYYQFPVSKGVNLTAGALVRNTEMAWVPTAYRSEILDFFTTAGAPGVYNKATGAGFGVQYVQPGKNGGIVAGLNYVAQNGQDSTTGVFSSSGALNTLAQLGYRAPNWGVAFGYRYGTQGTRVRTFNALNGGSGVLTNGQGSSGYAINAYWQPLQSGWVPSVSVGYGWNYVSGAPVPNNNGATNSQTWMAGLQWADALAKGNAFGAAVGQPGNTQGLPANTTIWEVFYKYRVSDNISVTPALFYVSNNQAFAGASSNVGGVIQTKFTF
jgi:hypothetical protein